MDVMDRVVTLHFPPLWADVVRRTPPERVSVQPVFDAIALRYVSGRLVLAGDAGATARPHTASGAMKAVETPWRSQARAGHRRNGRPSSAAYDRERSAAGAAWSGLAVPSPRAGGAHSAVGRMSEADFLRWWREAASGRRPCTSERRPRPRPYECTALSLIARASARSRGRGVVEYQRHRQAEPGGRVQPVPQVDRAQRVESECLEAPAHIDPVGRPVTEDDRSLGPDDVADGCRPRRPGQASQVDRDWRVSIGRSGLGGNAGRQHGGGRRLARAAP